MNTLSLSQTRPEAAQRAARAVSFDVFDTFLLRRCTAPDGVYELACHHAPIADRRAGLVESFVQHRQQAEARARRLAGEMRGTTEVGIGEIYEHFPFRLFGLDRDAVEALVAAEFRAELELCLVNPEMARQYDERRGSGARTGFISDTYWSAAQLAGLLRACRPGLAWDFLYVSSQHGTAKGDRLFARYLEAEGLDPAAAIHIGGNDGAGIAGARRHGIRALHVPQAGKALASVLQRETAAYRLLCSAADGGRLDAGMRTLRRVVAARAPKPSPAFTLGVTVLGPVVAAFDRFVADRTARVRAPGRRVATAFLARDGFLPWRTWRQTRAEPVHYVALDRRIAMMGSATTTEPPSDFVRSVGATDAGAADQILKADLPRLRGFFGRYSGGITSGTDLADALADLVDEHEISTLSAALRAEVLAHLRATVPDFDRCTDLVLADLGHSGAVQKALRRILDEEGVRLRLHGLYLLSADDKLGVLGDGDTAEGFVSDQVVTPHVKRLLRENAALLEQLCCAPEGSVARHDGGTVARAPDPRPMVQHVLVAAAQDGALHFAEQLAAGGLGGADPFADLGRAAAWTAALVARLLLMPTDDELALLGRLVHDIDLGTRSAVPLTDPAQSRNLTIAQALPSAFMTGETPMWPAASLGSVSPALGFLHAMFGAGHLPGDVFGDAKAGTLGVAVLTPTGGRTVQVPCFRAAFGEVRLRVPLSCETGAEAIAVPLAQIAPTGLLQGVTIQTGDSVTAAMASTQIRRLPPQALTAVGLDIRGTHYSLAEGDQHDLVVIVPAFRDKYAIVTVVVAPLGGERVLALAEDGMPN